MNLVLYDLYINSIDVSVLMRDIFCLYVRSFKFLMIIRTQITHGWTFGTYWVLWKANWNQMSEQNEWRTKIIIEPIDAVCSTFIEVRKNESERQRASYESINHPKMLSVLANGPWQISSHCPIWYLESRQFATEKKAI